jgi:hypothetical protein
LSEAKDLLLSLSLFVLRCHSERSVEPLYFAFAVASVLAVAVPPTHRQSLGQAKQSKSVPYPFAADQNREPCFSDSEVELSPARLAEELLDPVFSFFAGR